jgi:hypothetical protein
MSFEFQSCRVVERKHIDLKPCNVTFSMRNLTYRKWAIRIFLRLTQLLDLLCRSRYLVTRVHNMHEMPDFETPFLLIVFGV